MSLNDKVLKIKNFEDYCKLFLPPDASYAHSKMDRSKLVFVFLPPFFFLPPNFLAIQSNGTLVVHGLHSCMVGGRWW